MAKTTHVNVSYRRQISPKQYESEEVRLEGSFEIEDGESFQEVAFRAGIRARFQAHRILGLTSVETVPFAPFTGHGGDGEPQAEDKPKRKRRTKAEMEAAKATPGADAAAPATGNDAFDPTEGGDPSADDDDFSFDDEAQPAADISDSDLQKKAAATMKRLGRGADPVKDVMRQFGVHQLSALAEDKRPAFLAALDKLA